MFRNASPRLHVCLAALLFGFLMPNPKVTNNSFCPKGIVATQKKAFVFASVSFGQKSFRICPYSFHMSKCSRTVRISGWELVDLWARWPGARGHVVCMAAQVLPEPRLGVHWPRAPGSVAGRRRPPQVRPLARPMAWCKLCTADHS